MLTDPGFESATNGQNCNHNNALGCPTGWSAWIQPIDTSDIGQVATSSSRYGCNVGGQGVLSTNFWCDGSVQGYDALYQHLTGLVSGSTYDISFRLQDDSGSAMTLASSTNCQVDGNSCIDMLVYAGDNLPIGTVSLLTPEPGTFALFGFGLVGLGVIQARRSRKA
jgi:hypothetical protein